MDPAALHFQCTDRPGFVPDWECRPALIIAAFQIVPVQRRQNCHCENLWCANRGNPAIGRRHHVGVACNSQGIKIKTAQDPCTLLRRSR